MLYLTYERPTSFEVFLTKVRHIVRKMYNGNDERVEDIYRIARHFRKYLIAEEPKMLSMVIFVKGVFDYIGKSL